MPSTPSQKSIDVCRPAPTCVMWWTPWVWSLRNRHLGSLVLDELRLVFAAPQRLPGHELHARLDDERTAQLLANRLRESSLGLHPARQLDVHRQRRVLFDARSRRANEDVAAHRGGEP